MIPESPQQQQGWPGNLSQSVALPQMPRLLIPPPFLAMAAAHMAAMGKLNYRDIEPIDTLGPLTPPPQR